MKPAADKVAEHRARKLAAIPEQTFEAALEGDAEQMPSEAAVLRAAKRENRPAL